MKTTQRIPKAIVVIAVVGLGMLHNMKDNNLIIKPFNEFKEELSQSMVKADSVRNDENKFIAYTKLFISSSIRHLISNL